MHSFGCTDNICIRLWVGCGTFGAIWLTRRLNAHYYIFCTMVAREKNDQQKKNQLHRTRMSVRIEQPPKRFQSKSSVRHWIWPGQLQRKHCRSHTIWIMNYFRMNRIMHNYVIIRTTDLNCKNRKCAQHERERYREKKVVDSISISSQTPRAKVDIFAHRYMQCIRIYDTFICILCQNA